MTGRRAPATGRRVAFAACAWVPVMIVALGVALGMHPLATCALGEHGVAPAVGVSLPALTARPAERSSSCCATRAFTLVAGDSPGWRWFCPRGKDEAGAR